MVAKTDPTPRAIPKKLVDLFSAASHAEQTAREAHRRTAFRNTRHLIAGAHANGLLLSEIATILNVSTNTIRNRNGGDGIVAASDFANLIGLPPETLTRWNDEGILSQPTPAQDGRPGYLASELIRVLITTAQQPSEE